MVKREELYFDSRDNENKIHGVRWIPERDDPICILQVIHGMAEYIERYDEFARAMAEKGILVYIWLFLRKGCRYSSRSGFPQTEKNDTGKISGRALSDSWTQHGIFYFKELPVPLRDGSPGGGDCRNGNAAEAFAGNGKDGGCRPECGLRFQASERAAECVVVWKL